MSDDIAIRATTEDRSALTKSALALEVMLDALTKYGKPRLMHMGDGRHCCVQMYVTAEGVDFEVKTGFKHKTPSEAAEECCRRLDKVLRGMGI